MFNLLSLLNPSLCSAQHVLVEQLHGLIFLLPHSSCSTSWWLASSHCGCCSFFNVSFLFILLKRDLLPPTPPTLPARDVGETHALEDFWSSLNETD